MRLKRALAGGLAAASLAVAAPFFGTAVANSAAPAPLRAAASQVAIPEASAAYPYQCSWRWQRVPTPWWMVPKYALVKVCYQIPN